jgi:hypothetical protein
VVSLEGLESSTSGFPVPAISIDSGLFHYALLIFSIESPSGCGAPGPVIQNARY